MPAGGRSSADTQSGSPNRRKESTAPPALRAAWDEPPSAHRLAIHRVEQGPYVGVAKAARSNALDHLDEEGLPRVQRSREDLHEVGELVAIDEDFESA